MSNDVPKAPLTSWVLDHNHHATYVYGSGIAEVDYDRRNSNPEPIHQRDEGAWKCSQHVIRSQKYAEKTGHDQIHDVQTSSGVLTVCGDFLFHVNRNSHDYHEHGKQEGAGQQKIIVSQQSHQRAVNEHGAEHSCSLPATQYAKNEWI